MCRDASGQALAETAISLTVLMMILLGLFQLSMLASTKHIVNYAAFAAARASMYGGATSRGMDQGAMDAVIRMMYWGRRPIGRGTRAGFRVDYPTPWALPLFNNAPGGVVVVSSVSPVATQPDIPEVGDNADP